MQRYLVIYDIPDDRTRTKVHQCLKGWGTWIQYSVFVVDLSLAQYVRMRTELRALIDHAEDQILMFDLGPVEGRSQTCVEYLGIPFLSPEDGPIII